MASILREAVETFTALVKGFSVTFRNMLRKPVTDLDMVRAIRSMSRASTRLTASELQKALDDEETAPQGDDLSKAALGLSLLSQYSWPPTLPCPLRPRSRRISSGG